MNESYQKSINRNASRIKDYYRQEDKDELSFTPNFVADPSLRTLQLYKVVDMQQYNSYARR